MGYEVPLRRTMMFYPLAVGEDSLLDSNLVLAENSTGVSDFREHCTISLMTHTYVMSNSCCTLYGFISHNVRDAFCQAWTVYSSLLIIIMSGGVYYDHDRVTSEKFCDPAFIDQETARDTFVVQLCCYIFRAAHEMSAFSPYVRSPIVDFSTISKGTFRY
ncbi:hypothetical protein TNCV_1542381 [Trichonephila clavipes]|nr:hypothetical protein TNCV_1542381 [Trichonephila clavipes]